MDYRAVGWKDPRDKRVVMAITDGVHIYKRGHAGYVFRHGDGGATKLHASELPHDAFYALFGREKPDGLRPPEPVNLSRVSSV